MSKSLISLINVITAITLQLNIAPAQTIIKIQDPILEIPKINLKQEFYPNNPEKNNVDKGLQVIETSKMPNIKGSNLIIASHSGNSR